MGGAAVRLDDQALLSPQEVWLVAAEVAVEPRSCSSRAAVSAADAVAARRLAVPKASRAMDDQPAAARAAGRARDGHVDQARSRPEPPQRGRAAVAQHGAAAQLQDGRQPPPPLCETAVPGREDAPPDANQRALRHAPIDGIVAKAQIPKLALGDHPVLAPQKDPEPPIARGVAGFTAPITVKPATPRFSPPPWRVGTRRSRPRTPRAGFQAGRDDGGVNRGRASRSGRPRLRIHRLPAKARHVGTRNLRLREHDRAEGAARGDRRRDESLRTLRAARGCDEPPRP